MQNAQPKELSEVEKALKLLDDDRNKRVLETRMEIEKILREKGTAIITGFNISQDARIMPYWDIAPTT